MPFKKDKYGNWHYDPNGKYRLPPGPKAWVNEKKQKEQKQPPAQATKGKQETK